MTRRRIVDLIGSFINHFNDIGINEYAREDIRGKIRLEIPSAVLYARCKLEIYDKTTLELCRMLCKKQNSEFMWDEYGYCVTDENIGFTGLVTTSFVLISLVECYRYFKKEDFLEVIIKSCDMIYFHENNGYIYKAKENKSNVLNTNLLAAIALKECSDILPDGSNRKKLYDEFSRRVIRKVLGYQSFGGEFPYHFDSIAVPILYQAMVCAELRRLCKYYNETILKHAVANGNMAMEKYFDANGHILWDKANNHDKKGAVWAYGFTMASTDNNELEKKILRRLEDRNQNGLFYYSDFDEKLDGFYSAWNIFGLVWSLEKCSIKYNLSLKDAIKFLILKFEYFCRKISFFKKYILNKYYNFIFDSGALENRSWRKS